jgi:hypothetical protein
MSSTTVQIQVQQVLENAFSNQDTASQLLANPAGILKQNGINIPEGAEEQFNEYVRAVAPDMMALLSTSAQGHLETAKAALPQSVGCWGCKIGVWSIATAIVAVGVASLSELVAGSAVVVALADFAGVSEGAALAFIQQGLMVPVRQGAEAVASAICKWTHAC